MNKARKADLVNFCDQWGDYYEDFVNGWFGVNDGERRMLEYIQNEIKNKWTEHLK